MTARYINTNKFALISVITYCCTVKLDLYLSLSKKRLLELSLTLLEDHKLGLSLVNISEFVEILDVLLISTEEGTNDSK